MSILTTIHEQKSYLNTSNPKTTHIHNTFTNKQKISKDIAKPLGSLFVIGTPIGNLKDITIRAIEILKDVNIILTERRSTTYKLLNTYNIKNKKLITYREDNHNKLINLIVKFLKQGKTIALVSEAGTPLFSDPGQLLLKEIKLLLPEIRIVPIPGPSALITAFSVFDKGRSPKILFLGFAPTKPIRISKFINKHINLIQKQKLTLIYFLSKKTLLKTLKELSNLNEQIPIEIGLAKELTKIHETILTGNPKVIFNIVSANPELQKGEFVLLITLKE